MIHNILKQSLNEAESLYHRLVLLVGKAGSGKTSVFRDFSKDVGTRIINVNLELSRQLLELSERQRVLELPRILENIVKDIHDIAILDNIEILFDVSLKQDPLKLLQNLSRNRTIFVTWNGYFDGKRITYAKSNHPEYKTYETKGVLVTCMDGTTNFDTINNIKEANII